jgi:hypothetical protein
MMGVSGAGKSTWVKANTYGDVVVCSSDPWHIGPNGYVYDPAMARYAHAACLRKFLLNLRDEAPHGFLVPNQRFIVVDNTNTTLVELAPYVALTLAYVPHPQLEIVYIKADPEACKERTQHATPPQVIDLMAANLDTSLAQWPAHWPKPQVVE